MAVAELQDEPLLGEEEPVVEQVLAVELGDPRRLVDDQRDDELLEVVGAEMVALGGVGGDQHARHQRVVGHVPSPFQKGEKGLTTPSRWRIDSTIPSTHPP